MDSGGKDKNASFDSENEDDGLSSKDSEDEHGVYDEEEQEPNGAMQSGLMEAELDRGDSRELDNIEGDGELVEGDASPVLESLEKEPESADADSVECQVEDTLDEEHAAFIHSLKVQGNADHIERELLKMPSFEDAVDEVKCARDDRVITLHPFGLDDFCNPKFLAALREKGCEEVRHQFIRPEGNRDDWVGFVMLNFGSVSSALRAAEELKDFREGVEVKVQIQGSQSSRFNIRRWKASVKGKHRWSDGLLMVKNIGESTSESKLSTLFPGASILLHRESSSTSGGVLKGFAYIVYPMKEEADAILAKYKGKKITLDGRRVVIMKYFDPEKTTLPEGMLRLGERRLVMHNINELNEMIGSANRDTTPLHNKVKALEELIDKDDCIRQQIGLPNPSFDRLNKMNSLRQFSEREKTTILQRLLNPPPPPTPSKPEAPKAESSEKSSAAKTGQTRKRKNRGKKSSKETAVTLNLNIPPPVLPLLRPAFGPRLQVPQPASALSQQLRASLSLMLQGGAPTSPMRTLLPAKPLLSSIGNWMQPPPVGVPPPTAGPLGTKPLSRAPMFVPPPTLPPPTVPPLGLLNSPPGHPSRVPQPAPFIPRPQRSFPPSGVPPWRFPPPSGRIPPPSGRMPQPLIRAPGEIREPPLKMARFDRAPQRSILGPMPMPKFRNHVQQQRRF